jgi:hypothetical protein
MNKVIFPLCALLAVSACATQPITPYVPTLCETQSSLGSTIMSGRQAGVPMAKQIAVIKANSSNDALSKSFSRYQIAMIKLAYKTPAWSSSLLRESAIDDWGHQFYIACKEAGYY